MDPLRVQELTYDQLTLLCCDEKELVNPNKLKGPPTMLIAKGLLKDGEKLPPGKSLTEYLREKKQAKQLQEARRRKKERRRQRRAELKRQRDE